VTLPLPLPAMGLQTTTETRLRDSDRGRRRAVAGLVEDAMIAGASLTGLAAVRRRYRSCPVRVPGVRGDWKKKIKPGSLTPPTVSRDASYAGHERGPKLAAPRASAAPTPQWFSSPDTPEPTTSPRSDDPATAVLVYPVLTATTSCVPSGPR